MTRFGSDVALSKVARRGDILAALNQEVLGDISNTQSHYFDSVVERFEGETAYNAARRARHDGVK